jgi:hypothetical protein
MTVAIFLLWNLSLIGNDRGADHSFFGFHNIIYYCVVLELRLKWMDEFVICFE